MTSILAGWHVYAVEFWQDVINKKKAAKHKDEDDWGDEELGDDLLPM